MSDARSIAIRLVREAADELRVTDCPQALRLLEIARAATNTLPESEQKHPELLAAFEELLHAIEDLENRVQETVKCRD